MEIRIGIVNAPRELVFDTNESADAVRSSVTSALEQGTTHVTFNDEKGNSYLIPTSNLGYIQFGDEQARRVGFVA